MGKMKAVAAGDEDHGHGADNRPKIGKKASKAPKQREHEGDRHAEDEETSIGHATDHCHGDALSDQPAPKHVAGLMSIRVTSLRRPSGAMRGREPHVSARIDGEINAEKQPDQKGANGAEHGNRNGGGAARNVPGIELTQDLGDVEVLESSFSLSAALRTERLLTSVATPVAS